MNKAPEHIPQRFLKIDEEGFALMDQIRVSHEEFGHHLLANLRRDPLGYFYTEADGHWALVEPFDEPLVAHSVERLLSPQTGWEVIMPYGFRSSFVLDSLSLDEWDRFHGRTEEGVPFVLSRKAQAQFFDLLDGFGDDFIQVQEKVYKIPSWPRGNSSVEQSGFWQEIFCRDEPPPFDLGQSHSLLPKVLAQLKITKQRVMVLGAGAAHDAAHFAEQGHLVTAVDFCPEAISRAKSKYGHLKNLRFIQQDLFSLGEEHFGQYDLIFEHTCYCAISPERRNELVQLWLKILTEDGYLLGIFFAFDQLAGPPFGGSEWELRQRLKKNFQFLYWTRWRQSIPRRIGKEVVIYARRHSSL